MSDDAVRLSLLCLAPRLSDQLRDNRDGGGIQRRTLTDDKASSGTGLSMVAIAFGCPDKEGIVGLAGRAGRILASYAIGFAEPPAACTRILRRGGYRSGGTSISSGGGCHVEVVQ